MISEVDYWYANKEQNFKIGDWFYLYSSQTHKLNTQEIINIKFGIKPKSNKIEVIHKICRIEDNKIIFLIKDNIEVKK